MLGTVKRIYHGKNFGFVKGDDGKEYFLHKSSVVADIPWEGLDEGERVMFEPDAGPKGPRAESVERA